VLLYYHFLLTFLYVPETLIFPCFHKGQVGPISIKTSQSRSLHGTCLKVLFPGSKWPIIASINNCLQWHKEFSHTHLHIFMRYAMSSAEVPIQSLTSQSKHWGPAEKRSAKQDIWRNQVGTFWQKPYLATQVTISLLHMTSPHQDAFLKILTEKSWAHNEEYRNILEIAGGIHTCPCRLSQACLPHSLWIFLWGPLNSQEKELVLLGKGKTGSVMVSYRVFMCKHHKVHVFAK